MNTAENIKYLRHNEIDKKKWDECIGAADNNLIYGYSFYLDQMSPHWEALVYGEYQTVMPLTWKRKFGIRYLYQPFLTAQLGVFGKNIQGKDVESFIDSIPTSFRLIEISLNSANHHAKNKHITYRTNYVLLLSQSYTILENQYNDNTRRNIKKAIQAGYTVEKNIDVEKIIVLALEQMKSYGSESAENVDRFRKLYNHLAHNNSVLTYGVITADQQLVSSAVFFVYHKRAYYILVGNNPGIKSQGASHLLIDAFIQDHAGKELTLDFEGSDISSLAFFYSGFGALKETYPFLKVNRLPFYMRWAKR